MIKGGETLILMLDRWKKLYKDLYNKKADAFDLSKVPDVHDNIRYEEPQRDTEERHKGCRHAGEGRGVERGALPRFTTEPCVKALRCMCVYVCGIGMTCCTTGTWDSR
jgi:hypothetical protein